MALQISYTDNRGVASSGAYAKIGQIVSGLSEGNEFTEILVEIFHNAAARSKGTVANRKESVHVEVITVRDSANTTYFADTVLDDTDKNLTKQAYIYLKTLDTPVDFSSSSDV